MTVFASSFDLGEVTLVNVEVVRFLSECEDRGIVLVHCPPYVREWILRERAEGAQPRVPNGVLFEKGIPISLASSGPCYQILYPCLVQPPQKVSPSVAGEFLIATCSSVEISPFGDRAPSRS
jgi:hypothetical protein